MDQRPLAAPSSTDFIRAHEAGAEQEHNNKEEWRQQEKYRAQQHAPNKFQYVDEEPPAVQSEPIILGAWLRLSRRLKNACIATSEGDG
jgi:hypothetical protein